ncbi:hypothetical protein HDU97_003561 [Phlyctochytrium planicorne]|nr:hypothetical protein HDU97_003561 [Phlyctochytrium planicorne]
MTSTIENQTPVQLQNPLDSLEAQILASSRRIMVAEDGSPSSKNAFIWTLDHVLQKGDAFVIVRVLSDEDCWDLYSAGNDDASNNMARVMQKCADHLLKEYTELVQKHRPSLKDVTVLADVKVGSPKNVITDLAKDMKVDLLVMGKRGLGTVKRLLIGSVSDYVVRHATCPVVTIPLPQGN